MYGSWSSWVTAGTGLVVLSHRGSKFPRADASGSLSHITTGLAGGGGAAPVDVSFAWEMGNKTSQTHALVTRDRLSSGDLVLPCVV